MPDQFKPSSQNRNTINMAYSRDIQDEHQAYLQMQPWQSDDNMNILTTDNYETLYTNGPELSGLDRVEPSASLAYQLNSINVVNQLNVREQIKKALDTWDDGPWYVTGDESNLIFHNHQEDLENPDTGLVYYYNGENGEVLKVTIASKDIFGASAIKRSTQPNYMAEQTIGTVIPTADDLKDVDISKVNTRSAEMSAKTPTDIANDEFKQYQKDIKDLQAAGYIVTPNGDSLDIKYNTLLRAREQQEALAKQSGLTLDLKYNPSTKLLDLSPITPKSKSTDEELSVKWQRAQDYYSKAVAQQKADEEATRKAEKQAIQNFREADRSINNQNPTITEEERYNAILHFAKLVMKDSHLTDEQRRLATAYALELEAKAITPETQAAYNRMVSRLKFNRGIEISTKTKHWQHEQGTEEIPIYSVNEFASASSFAGNTGRTGAPYKANYNYYSTEVYDRSWIFESGGQYQIHTAGDVHQSGALAYDYMNIGTKMGQSVSSAMTDITSSRTSYENFAKRIQQSIEEQLPTRKQNGYMLEGVRVFTEKTQAGTNQLRYQLLWKKLENKTVLSFQDLLASNPENIDLVKTADEHTRRAFDSGLQNANKALNHMRRAKFREIQVQLKVIGRPSLEAPGMLKLFNIGQRYSGLWYIKTCIHQIDSSAGYTTSLTLIKNKATAKDSSHLVKVKQENEEQVAISTLTIESRNPDGTSNKVDVKVDDLKNNMMVLDRLKAEGNPELTAAAQVLINNGKVIYYTDDRGNVQMNRILLEQQRQRLEEERNQAEEDIRNKTARVKQLTQIQKDAQAAQTSLAKVNAKDVKSLKYAAETVQKSIQQANQATQQIQGLTSNLPTV